MAPSSSDSLGFDPGQRAHESEVHAFALRREENIHCVLQLYRVRVTDGPSEGTIYPWRHSERADYVEDPDHSKWAMVQWDRENGKWTRPMGPVVEWQEEMLSLPAPTKKDFEALAAREEELRARSRH